MKLSSLLKESSGALGLEQGIKELYKSAKGKAFIKRMNQIGFNHATDEEKERRMNHSMYGKAAKRGEVYTGDPDH